MQLQPKTVDTDAELLAATVSMAIVIKSKNPRMRRPLSGKRIGVTGYTRNWLGPRDSVSGAAWRSASDGSYPTDALQFSQLCLPSAGVCHTLRAAADPGLPQNHVRGHVILVATPCSSSDRVAGSTWSVCPSGGARVRARVRY